MAKKRYHAIIKGLVQGVFFRIFAKKTAQSLDIKGYTKNLPDGTVEVVVEGEESNIKVILDWLKKGPSSAKVMPAMSINVIREVKKNIIILFM